MNRQLEIAIEQALGKTIENIRKEPFPNRTGKEKVPHNDNYITHEEAEKMLDYALSN